MLYFVAKTLLQQPRHIRYRGFVYALLIDKRFETDPEDAPAQPTTVNPKEAVRSDVVPTNALDRIQWSEPRVDHQDVVVEGQDVRGGKTVLEGQLYWQGEFVEPKIKIVFSWAYIVDPNTSKPKLVYVNLEGDSSHDLVDAHGNYAEFNALTLSYLSNAVKKATNKDITVLPSAKQPEPVPVKKQLHASTPPQKIRFRGATYELVA